MNDFEVAYVSQFPFAKLEFSEIIISDAFTAPNVKVTALVFVCVAPELTDIVGLLGVVTVGVDGDGVVVTVAPLPLPVVPPEDGGTQVLILLSGVTVIVCEVAVVVNAIVDSDSVQVPVIVSPLALPLTFKALLFADVTVIALADITVKVT